MVLNDLLVPSFARFGDELQEVVEEVMGDGQNSGVIPSVTVQ
jgi:hypothetical protein